MNVSLRRTMLAAGALSALAGSPSFAALSLTSLSHFEDFNFLSSTTDSAWTNDQTSESPTGSPGWYWAGGPAAPYDVSNGSDAVGSPYSFGPTGNSDRSMGSWTNAADGNSYTAWGLVIQNNLSAPISGLTVSFTGEKWRNGAVPIDTLTFSYLISSTNITNIVAAGGPVPVGWTARTALNVDFPSVGAPNVAVNGNAAANQFSRSETWAVTIPIGEYIALRWHDANDPIDFDAGISIDDLTVTVAVPEPSAFLFLGMACSALGAGAAWQQLSRRFGTSRVRGG